MPFKCNQCSENNIFMSKRELIQHLDNCTPTKNIENFRTYQRWILQMRTGQTDMFQLKTIEEIIDHAWRLFVIVAQKGPKKRKANAKFGNPEGIYWMESTKKIHVNANATTFLAKGPCEGFIFAEKGFPISEKTRNDNLKGTIIYYFEIAVQKLMDKESVIVGFANKRIAADSILGQCPNYAFQVGLDYCQLSGVKHYFEFDENPMITFGENEIGSGLLLTSDNQLDIFFTTNGILMGKQMRIVCNDDLLFPTLHIKVHRDITLEANFGNDKDKPFKYDIGKCPGIRIQKK